MPPLLQPRENTIQNDFGIPSSRPPGSERHHPQNITLPANRHPVSISIEPFTYPENESSFGLKCGKEGQGEAEEEDFEEITANSFGPANEGKVLSSSWTGTVSCRKSFHAPSACSCTASNLENSSSQAQAWNTTFLEIMSKLRIKPPRFHARASFMKALQLASYEASATLKDLEDAGSLSVAVFTTSNTSPIISGPEIIPFAQAVRDYGLPEHMPNYRRSTEDVIYVHMHDEKATFSTTGVA